MYSQRATILIAGLAAMAGLAGCGDINLEGIEGSGEPAEEVREVGEFRGVSVESGINATVEIGPDYYVQIKADDNLIDRIETEVEDGILHIRPDGMSLRPRTRLEAVVHMPAAESLSASGGATLESTGGSGDMTFASSGGAELAASDLELGSATASVSGGAEMTLEGSGDRLVADVSGGAQIDSGDLTMRSVELSGSGGGGGRIRAEESIVADLSGGSQVCYEGEPGQVNANTSGGGSLEPC